MRSSASSSSPSRSREGGSPLPKEYRSRLRIILDLLRAVKAENPATTTRLLFLANLSHERLTGYLEDVTTKGWVSSQEGDGRRTYRITPEGERVLGELDRIERFMGDFGLGL